MEKIARGLMFVLIAIAIVIGVCGFLSFFMPENSSPSIIWLKLHSVMMICALSAQVVALNLDKRRLLNENALLKSGRK